MKKVLVISALVIVLICINWLSQASAQVTAEQMRAYQEFMKKRGDQTSTETGTYTTPPIYNESEATYIDSVLETASRATEASSNKRNARPTAADSNAIDGAQFHTPPAIASPTMDANNQLLLPATSQVNRFGENLFARPQVGEINPATVPDDYLLGPGDNIIINLWGRVQQEWNLTVDRQGKVFIPKVGDISAWGITLDEFESHLASRLSSVYTGFEKKVTLGKIRTIKVFIYGEVRAPGGYAVSALSTLFTALYNAGGPTDKGSFRQIKLIRNKKTIAVDLYDFLVAGDKSCDVPLQSGDVVFVPLVGPQATIRGAVKRPAIYELAADENVSALIELAGGPTADAYLGRLMLDRITDNDGRKIIDIEFGETARDDMPLVDGDDLSVFSIYKMRQNLVWINGMVKHPGTFERGEQMRISDLIEKGQLLPTNVYLDRADLYRHNPDGGKEIIAVDLRGIMRGDTAIDIILRDLDSLHVYSTDAVERQRYVFVDGMVRTPGQYLLYDNMSVADLIFQAGSLNESAYMLEAELARIDSLGNTDVVYVRLDAESSGGLRLQENDHLFIRKIPGYQLHRTVIVEGEVRFPGRYSLTHQNETMWQLLKRAGGFSGKAFPIGTVCKRAAIIDDLRRINIGSILESSQPLIADSMGVLQPMQNISLRAESMDRIIIDMELLLATNGREGDFPLQAGDYIYVPETPTGISVLGEVCANGTIRYESDKKVKDYLEQAGGFTKRADKDEVRLVKANGRVYATDNVMGRHVDLGDVIVVPSEIKKDKDWSKVITTGLSVLTGMATTVLIIDRL